MKELASMILLATFSAFIIYGMKRAEQRGKQELKHFPQLDAIEEAVGRSAEMGKPVICSFGIGGFTYWTLAGLSILSHVARLTAKTGSRLIVPTGGTVLQESDTALVLLNRNSLPEVRAIFEKQKETDQ